jgi:very-short-patch-repair endonuclease
MPFDIATQIEKWRTRLLDLTKRNRLINFKTGRGGGLALAHPDPGDIWHHLVVGNAPLTFAWKRELLDLPEPAGDESSAPTLFDAVEPSAPIGGHDVLERCRLSPRLGPNCLLTELPDSALAARLTRLALNSQESLTERGVATLHVAFGFLRWFESPDSREEVRSPLLLVPVRLERENVEAPWQLRVEEEDILPNHSLVQLLANDFRLRLPLPEDDWPAAEDAGWRTRYFGEVQRFLRHLSRWEVLDEVALATFSFQKLAMWEDLGSNRERIAAHDLCRAIAGDTTVSLRTPSDLLADGDLDRLTHPSQTFHILDADSSQHVAIEAAKRGASLVLDGPPGTGKSQTIANIIAEFLAAGKTVLFVSEKAAALEVVQRRLQDKGLDDLCLACHSHKANKREVLAELHRSLALPVEAFHDAADELQRLYEARGRLNEYVRELHAVRLPLRKKAFEAHGELARLAHLPSRSFCPISQVLERDAAYLRNVEDLLKRLPDCRGVIENRDRHPWRGCRVLVFSQNVQDEIRHHFSRLAEALTQAEEVATALHKLGFGPSAPTWHEWLKSLEAARTVLACPLVPPEWFARDPRACAAAVVQLDELTSAYRRGVAALPEFAPGALRQADPAALGEAAEVPAGSLRLVHKVGDTLRTRYQRVVAVGKSLEEVRGTVNAVDGASKRVVELLSLSPPSLSVRALAHRTAVAKHVALMKPVRRSWWDAERRKELQAIATKCQAEARAAQETRAALAGRLSPRAFAGDSAALAAESGRFPSSLAWLLPWNRPWRWLPVKRQVSTWYVGETPKTAILMQDLAQVASYHRRTDYCAAVREQYGMDVMTSENGEPDWGETVGALESINRLLELLGQKMPAGLQEALSTIEGLDRPTLAIAAQALGEQLGSLRQQLKALAGEYDLTEVTEEEPHRVRISAPEFVAWIDTQLASIRQEAVALERAIGWLAEGLDLPAESWTDRRRALGELGKVRTQIAGLCGRIWSTAPPAGAEERDWAKLRDAAAALLVLLGKIGARLPAPVVSVLTGPTVRAELAQAMSQGDAIRGGGIDESWRFLARLFDLRGRVSTGILIEAAPLSDLFMWLAGRVEDTDRLLEWTQFCEVERETARMGASTILAEVMGGRVKPEEAHLAFRARFLRLWLDAVYERVPILRQFASDAHDRLAEQFRELDRRAVASASARVRAFQLSRPDRPRPGAIDSPPSSELGTLLREVNKKRRQLPLRKLFGAIPRHLLLLKPCLMMSPLAVSTYLESPDLQFDLVIFDEASQVRPHDAICAIYRGRQLMVAGDRKQLPPTSFFERSLENEGLSSDDGGEEGTDLEDFESVLDVCCTLSLRRCRLRWHYRSRREGLIAFANSFVYDNELVTFPSVHDMDDNLAIAFEYVSEGRWRTGAAFNIVEARRTAELVMAHAREHPEQSLGVIAFSQPQQLRILDELERLRRDHPDLEQFFREDGNEPFFVKNLENVQGDERDVIFLGIAYGPNEADARISMNFGALNRQGGERRLNVAVTRAKHRMTVISSLRAENIDLRRTSALGARLLRAYLDYAERGPMAIRAVTTIGSNAELESPFEREIYDELTKRGLILHPQVGCSGFRIDLGVVDAQAPGRYLLGVECDGATYHSSPTARDRDRLRQEVLVELGWRICRIWSTDWLRDREAQVRRVLAALEAARHARTAPKAVTAPAASRPAQRVSPQPASATGATPAVVGTTYESIDEVPESVVREFVRDALRAHGATEAGELIRHVARQLNFRRTGPRIQARIEECLKKLLAANQICHTADQRLQLVARDVIGPNDKNRGTGGSAGPQRYPQGRS